MRSRLALGRPIIWLLVPLGLLLPVGRPRHEHIVYDRQVCPHDLPVFGCFEALRHDTITKNLCQADGIGPLGSGPAMGIPGTSVSAPCRDKVLDWVHQGTMVLPCGRCLPRSAGAVIRLLFRVVVRLIIQLNSGIKPGPSRRWVGVFIRMSCARLIQVPIHVLSKRLAKPVSGHLSAGA